MTEALVSHVNGGKLIAFPTQPHVFRKLLARVASEHARTLQRMAQRLTGDAEEARDVVQAALERALSRATTIQTEQELLAWLVVVMRNLALDGHRQRARERTVSLDDRITERLHLDTPIEGARDEATIDQKVEQAMKQLDPRLRESLRLQQRGLSLIEIANALGTQPATVGTRVHRARQQLRALLAQQEQPPRERATYLPAS